METGEIAIVTVVFILVSVGVWAAYMLIFGVLEKGNKR